MKPLFLLIFALNWMVSLCFAHQPMCEERHTHSDHSTCECTHSAEDVDQNTMTCTMCGGEGRRVCAGCFGAGQRAVPSWNSYLGTVTYTYYVCSFCGGRGSTECSLCGGKGQIRIPEPTFSGAPVYTGGGSGYDAGSSSSSSSSSGSSSSDRYGYRPCPTCYGSGTCQTCHGSGFTNNYYTGNTIKCSNCYSGAVGKCSVCQGKGKIYGVK